MTLEYYDANGDSIAYRTFNEFGYVVDHIPDGATSVYVYVSNEFNPNEYIPFYAYQLTDSHVDISNLTLLENTTRINEDEYTTSITVVEPSIVVTSLAYDPGWIVSIDGQIIDTYRVNQAFLGFDISEGNHQIHIEYEPSYFTASLVVSAGSVVLTLLVSWIFNKPQNRNNIKTHNNLHV